MRIALPTTICLLLIFAACSPEKPIPPQSGTVTTTTAAPPPAATQTSVPELQKGTYDEALLWLRSTPHFRFVLDDRRIHAEGEMTRKTPGAEKVQFTANDEEWLAEATRQGVTWKRRDGGAWKADEGPYYGGRVYQRVTVAFDPQKKEGVPLLISSEGASNLYRFTDANTGEVHEVWVRKADSSIERMTIGDTVELTFAP
jgi:hypothetical protein